MNAFLLVCPHCQARYQLPNASTHGKTVTCKKCGEKFTAKLQKAAPAPQAAAPPQPQAAVKSSADDPFADLFSDSSAGADPLGGSSVGASPLASMPRKKSSSKPFPWGLVAIGGGGVAMLVVLIVVAISAMSALSSDGGLAGIAGGQSAEKRAAEQAYAQHKKIAQEQYEILLAFVVAGEALQSKDQVPAFLGKVRTATAQINSLANRVREAPVLDEEQTDRLTKFVQSKLSPLEARTKAAGANIGKYRTPEMVTAMVEFQNAGAALNYAVTEAKLREAEEKKLAARSSAAPSQPATPSRSPAPAQTAGTQSPMSNPAPAQPRQGIGPGAYALVYDSQHLIRTKFEAAAAEYRPGADPAPLVEKLRGLTKEMQALHEQLRDLPELTYIEQSDRDFHLRKRPYYLVNSHLKDVDRLLDDSSPEVIWATLNFHAADLDVIHGIKSTKSGVGSVLKDLGKNWDAYSEYVGILEAKTEIVVSILTKQGDVESTAANIRNLNERFSNLTEEIRPLYRVDSQFQDGLEKMAKPRFDAMKVARANAQEIAGNAPIKHPEAIQQAWDAYDKQYHAYFRVFNALPYRGEADINEDRINTQPKSNSLAGFGPRSFGSGMGPGRPEISFPRGMGERNAEESDSDRKLAEYERDRAAGMQDGEQPSGADGLPERQFGPPGMGRPGFGPPGMRPRGFGNPFNSQAFRDEVGLENMVRISMPGLSKEQTKEMFERLKGKVDTSHYSCRTSGDVTVLDVRYSGDVEELAKLIDFGEVDKVSGQQRTISLKSVSLPDEPVVEETEKESFFSTSDDDE